MANPQPTPFVQFSKELYDALLLSPMPGTHKEIVLAIIRRTYGDFGKTEAPVSLGLLRDMTGRNRSHLQRALAELCAAGVVQRVAQAGFTDPQILRLEKDYDSWGRYAPARPLRAEATGRAEATVQAAPVQQDSTCPGESTGRAQATMEDRRDRETEETSSVVSHGEVFAPAEPDEGEEVLAGELVLAAAPADDDFTAFWAVYPRHEARKKARAAWRRLSRSERELASGVAAVMGELVRLGAKERRFVPYAASFLNGRRWLDWEHGVPPGWLPPGADRVAAQDAALAAAVARAKEAGG